MIKGHINKHALTWLETYFDHDKHALGHIEGMSPVVIRHGSIVLPHGQKPAAQNLDTQRRAKPNVKQCCVYQIQHLCEHLFLAPYLIVNFKLLDDTKFQKHPERSGDHGVIVQREVVEVKLVDA